MLWETGRLDEAASRLREAVAQAPNKVSARHRRRESCLVYKGKPAAALTELSRAAELEPTSVEVQLDLGRALEATGGAAKAEAAYRRALEIQPDVPLAHYLLGTLLARGGRRNKGAEHIALYQRAFDEEQKNRYRSGSRTAELNLGWTRLKEKKFEEALVQFGRAPRRRRVSARGGAGSVGPGGSHTDAVQALERAVLIDPDNRALRYALDRERETSARR